MRLSVAGVQKGDMMFPSSLYCASFLPREGAMGGSHLLLLAPTYFFCTLESGQSPQWIYRWVRRAVWRTWKHRCKDCRKPNAITTAISRTHCISRSCAVIEKCVLACTSMGSKQYQLRDINRRNDGWGLCAFKFTCVAQLSQGLLPGTGFI